MSSKVIKIVDPSPDILNLQRETLSSLSGVLPNSVVEAIGSMAVPIPGKLELDILIISPDPIADIEAVEACGYKRGLEVGGVYHLNKYINNIEIAIQIVPVGHKIVEIHKSILKRLCDDEILRQSYINFKRTLDGLTKQDYKKAKSVWIKENLLKINKNPA